MRNELLSCDLLKKLSQFRRILEVTNPFGGVVQSSNDSLVATGAFGITRHINFRIVNNSSENLNPCITKQLNNKQKNKFANIILLKYNDIFHYDCIIIPEMELSMQNWIDTSSRVQPGQPQAQVCYSYRAFQNCQCQEGARIRVFLQYEFRLVLSHIEIC